MNLMNTADSLAFSRPSFFISSSHIRASLNQEMDQRLFIISTLFTANEGERSLHSDTSYRFHCS